MTILKISSIFQPCLPPIYASGLLPKFLVCLLVLQAKKGSRTALSPVSWAKSWIVCSALSLSFLGTPSYFPNILIFQLESNHKLENCVKSGCREPHLLLGSKPQIKPSWIKPTPVNIFWILGTLLTPVYRCPTFVSPPPTTTSGSYFLPFPTGPLLRSRRTCS